MAVLDHRWQSTIAVAHSMGIDDEINIRSVRRSLDKLNKRDLVAKELSRQYGYQEALWRLKAKPTKRPSKRTV